MYLPCLTFLVVMVGCVTLTDSDKCPNIKLPIASARKRRHLTFPDKSAAVMTISLVKAFMTHAPSGWNIALEIDVLFPLPEANFTNSQFRRKLHHRQRKELWTRIQDAVDMHNLNGRSCVLKSVCEAEANLAPPGKSLVHDLLRAIFTVPKNEEEFQNEMRGYYDEIENPDFCTKIYDCPFSILGFVLSLNKFV